MSTTDNAATEQVAKLREAIRLTREYVGEPMLPAVEGWSWFDAIKATGGFEGFGGCGCSLDPDLYGRDGVGGLRYCGLPAGHDYHHAPRTHSVEEPEGSPIREDLRTAREEALTAGEREALALTGKLAEVCRRVIGAGPNADGDWADMVYRIHAIQYAIMAQAAARAYPGTFRLLGQRLRPIEDPPL